MTSNESDSDAHGDLPAQLREITETSTARSLLHLAILDQTDDLTSVILKGHLIAEELLTAGIKASCSQPSHLDRARLRFGQLIAIFRSLERLPSAPAGFWECFLRLNRLRNELAHNLDQSRVPALSAEFVTWVERHHTEIKLPRAQGRDALVQALHVLLGRLATVTICQEALEKLNAPTDREAGT